MRLAAPWDSGVTGGEFGLVVRPTLLYGRMRQVSPVSRGRKVKSKKNKKQNKRANSPRSNVLSVQEPCDCPE